MGRLATAVVGGQAEFWNAFGMFLGLLSQSDLTAERSESGRGRVALTCLDPISHTGIELRSQELVEGLGAVTSVGIVSAPDWIGFFNQVGFFQDSFGILSGVFQDSSLKLAL